MRSFRYEIIEQLSRVVEEDEYNDFEQVKEHKNENNKQINAIFEFIKRNTKPGKVLEIGCGSGSLFQTMLITHAIEPNDRRREKAVEEGKKYGVEVVKGWAEAIPYPDNYFNTVIAFRTFWFVRSEDEALIEVNRVLRKGGMFLVDVLEDTTLPNAKTTNARCFANRANLFGYETIEFREFSSDLEKSERVFIALRKIRNFDYRWLNLPQLVKGKINNYIEERDWWLI